MTHVHEFALVLTGDEVEEDLWSNTMDHLTTYAKEGLRTLCMAKRVSFLIVSSFAFGVGRGREIYIVQRRDTGMTCGRQT